MKKGLLPKNRTEPQKTEGNLPGVRSELSALLMAVALLLLSGVGEAQAETLEGRPYVTDADTVRISGESIRLEGIDAPETNQRCKDASGKSYRCGLVSTSALKTKIGRETIRCKGSKRDRYGRLLGICYLGDIDLNGWLVRNGYALAYSRYSKRYVQQEIQAQKDGLGLWAGEFMPPWQWRKNAR